MRSYLTLMNGRQTTRHRITYNAMQQCIVMVGQAGEKHEETVVRELQFIMRDILCYSRGNNIIIWLSEHKAWIPADIITLLGSQAKLPCDSPLLLPARSPLILVVQSRQLRVLYWSRSSSTIYLLRSSCPGSY